MGGIKHSSEIVQTVYGKRRYFASDNKDTNVSEKRAIRQSTNITIQGNVVTK